MVSLFSRWVLHVFLSGQAEWTIPPMGLLSPDMFLENVFVLVVVVLEKYVNHLILRDNQCILTN